jgi:homoserine O-succinyltransferase
VRFAAGEVSDYPPFVDHYFSPRNQAMLTEYRERLEQALAAGLPIPEFPDALLTTDLDNTWRDTAHAVVGNWMGLVYQTTHRDRRRQFMDGIDADDPLGLGN